MKPSILIVAALFSPSRQIGARRPERFADQLAQRGWKVTVVTLDERFVQPVDIGMKDPVGVRVVRTGLVRPGERVREWAGILWRSLRPQRGHAGAGTSGPELLQGSHARRGVAESLKERFLEWESWLEFPDGWIGWHPWAVRALADRTFDVVLATIPPFTTALIARTVADRNRAPLVLDYRDPWSESPERISVPGSARDRVMKRMRRLENRCLARSSLVLGASRNICRLVADRTDRPIEFLPNSFDSGRLSEGFRRDASPNLVYVGTLSYGRSLIPVLKAIVRIQTEFSPGPVRLVYAGPHGDVVRREARDLGIEPLVADLGHVPHGKATALLGDAAAGVVIVSDRYEYMLPGKIFETIGSRRPVLLVGPDSSEAADLMRRHQLGWAHTPEDIEGIAMSIRAALRAEVPSPRDLDDFDTGRISDALDGALRRLVLPDSIGAPPVPKTKFWR